MAERFRRVVHCCIAVALAAACAASCGGPPGTQGSGGTKGPNTVASIEAPPARPSRSSGDVYTFDLPLEELRKRQDAILSDVQGTMQQGMLGKAHNLSQDEDLHFSMEAPSLGTPLVCELMNALSIPDAAQDSHGLWSGRLSQLFNTGATVTVRGVFRVWPDHASSREGDEADRTSSNPAHVLEIHPIASLSAGRTLYDTRANIAPITYDGQQYAYKDPGRWGDMLSHNIRTRVVRSGSRDYLELQTPQVGFNYWELRAQAITPVQGVPDGHRFSVHILTPTRAYREEVRCFTVEGTWADQDVLTLASGKEVVLAAIGRFDLRTLLKSDTYDGEIPVELCVFGINPPRLPAAGRHQGERTRAENGSGSASADSRSSGLARRQDRGGVYQPPGEGHASNSKTGVYQSPDAAATSIYQGATSGSFIGNRRTHFYHRADDPQLPAPQNRVYFPSAAEAEQAGYRAAGS